MLQAKVGFDVTRFMVALTERTLDVVVLLHLVQTRRAERVMTRQYAWLHERLQADGTLGQVALRFTGLLVGCCH